MTAVEPQELLAGLTGARPVRKAYEQVYDQLRRMILSGELPRGQRLPTEVALAEIFGASRGTVREALRLLVTEGLIRTAKGAGGGSYVTLPTVDHVSEFLERNVELLSLTQDVTLPEFLQARELIETWAARRVALAHTDADLERLRATIRGREHGESSYELYLANREFHAVLVDICHNTLLRLAAQPIFSVLHTHLSRQSLPDEFSVNVCTEHAAIFERIEAGDAEGAEERMLAHLRWLATVYRGIWRAGGPPIDH